jgi:hypothetical protein
MFELPTYLWPVSPDGLESSSGVVKGEEERVPRNARQVWTDDDLSTLAKYIKKFPGGTADRYFPNIGTVKYRGHVPEPVAFGYKAS